MATLTLYHAETGEPVRPDEPGLPGPVVAADDPEAIAFALDPVAARALVQFVVVPGNHRLVAGVQLGAGEDLRDVHRVIRERIAESDQRVARPDEVPRHLNVFHYLADPDPTRPEAEVRSRLLEADEPVEIEVPTVTDAMNVVAFVQERTPWKTVAVHAADASAGTIDARVTVSVNDDSSESTRRGREERGDDEAGAPGGPPTEPDAAPGPETAGANGGGESDGEAGVLRIYDGSSGTLEYDSRRPGQPPSAESDAAARACRDGLALLYDPASGLLRTIVQARGDGTSRRFVAEYERPGAGDELLGSFVRELADRVDDLGVEFVVDVGGDHVACDRLADADPHRPTALSDGALACLDRLDEPLDFGAPGATAALELVPFLARHLETDRSIAVCEAGRTDDLASTDVVVTFDPTHEDVEPLASTATRLAELRLQDRLTDARNALREVVHGVDEVTGTPEARQRVFAATLSSGALSGRGFTIVPTDDRFVGGPRRLARNLTLYGLLVAVIAGGVLTGEFDRVVPDPGSYRIDLEPFVQTPAAVAQQSHVVDGSLVLVASLSTIVLGAFWLLGLRVPRPTASLASGPVLSEARESAEAVRSSIDDLEAAYGRLAGRQGTIASESPDFAAFLERRLLGRPGVPQVEVVRRGRRWMHVLGGIATGVLVGAIVAGAVLGSLWIVVEALSSEPTATLDALVGVAGAVLLASIAKGLVVGRRTMSRTIHRYVYSSRNL